MEYSETKPVSPAQTKVDRMLALFQTQLSLENALAALKLHGYSPSEIEMKTHAEVAQNPGPAIDTDGASLQKAITGTKYGALAGSMVLGLIVTYLVYFQPDTLQAGVLATYMLGLIVGAVWGGTLGFLLVPQFHYKIKNKETIVSREQTLISFQPKSQEDEDFFKSLHWPMYPAQ